MRSIGKITLLFAQRVNSNRIMLLAAPHEFDLRNIEQDAAAMPRKIREACDLQICIDLRAVVDELQFFPVKDGPLIASKPFGIHIAEKTSE